MAEWYYAQNGNQQGPVTPEAMKQKIASGEVGPQDLVWREGLDNWQPAGGVAELQGPGGGAASYPYVQPAYAPQQGAPQQYGQPQYGQPQYPQQQYPSTGYPPQQGQPLQYGGAPTGYGYAPVPNYLVQSILVTLLCCLPFGIAAIVFASQVNGKLAAGDYAGAMESSQKAKKFITWSVIVGLVVIGIQIIVAIGGNL